MSGTRQESRIQISTSEANGLPGLIPRPGAPVPEGARWIELTNHLLSEPIAYELWCALARDFVPVAKKPGPAMAQRLRNKIRNQAIGHEIHALYNDKLLGVFELRPASALVERDSARPHEQDRMRGAMFDMIVRSQDNTEAGFGYALLSYAMILARGRDAEALFVRPANRGVEKMWCEDYGFSPVDRKGASHFSRLPFSRRIFYLPLRYPT